MVGSTWRTLGRGITASAVLAALVGLSGGVISGPAAAAGLAEGGTFTCAATVGGNPTVVYTQVMNAGTTGSTGSALAATTSGDTITSCALTGVIPQGGPLMCPVSS